MLKPTSVGFFIFVLGSFDLLMKLVEQLPVVDAILGLLQDKGEKV